MDDVGGDANSAEALDAEATDIFAKIESLASDPAALRAMVGSDPGAIIELFLSMVRAAIEGEQFEIAISGASAGGALARAFGLTSTEMTCDTYASVAHRELGHLDAAIDLAGGVMRMVADDGGHTQFAKTNALATLTSALLERDGAAAARKEVDAAIGQAAKNDPETFVLLKLVAMDCCKVAGDLDDAVAHLTGAADAGRSLDCTPLRENTVFLQRAYDLARELYYDREAYREASAAYDAMLALFGDGEPELVRMSALAHLQLRDFDVAAQGFRALLDRGHRTAGNYLNLGASLGADGRYAEAVAALTDGLAVDPVDGRLRLQRARFAMHDGNRAGALRDLGVVIADGDVAAAAAAPDANSAARFRRTSDARALALEARLDRATILCASGDRSGARLDLDAVASGHIPAFALVAYRQLADMAYEGGDLRGAVANLDRILDIDASLDDVRARRARLQVERGELEAASADVARLAARGAEPMIAYEISDLVLAGRPDDLTWRLLRGLALAGMYFPKHAVDDLNVAIEGGRRDAQALRTRAVCRVMAVGVRNATAPPESADTTFRGPWNDPAWLDEEAAWNGDLGPERIVGALKDLADAAACARDDSEAADALQTYRWVADQALGSFQLRILMSIDDGWAPANVIPAMQPATQELALAWRANANRRWSDAIVHLEEAQRGMRAAGFPREAVRLELEIADAVLRLDRVQETLDRLERCKVDLAKLIRPLTAELIPRADEVAAAAERYGTMSSALELEFMDLQSLSFGTVMTFEPLLRANAYNRIGLAERALEELGDLAARERQLAALSQFGAIRGIAQILRDAGQLTEARSLLERYRDRVNARDGALFDNTLVSILVRLDDTDAASVIATRMLRDAQDSDITTFESIVQLVAVNIARPNGDAAASLAMLDEVAHQESGGQASERLAYWEARGWLLFLLARLPEAIDAYRCALTIGEGQRTQLASIPMRAEWQAKLAKIYDEALSIALAAGDAASLFEFAERSRARTLLDELELRHAGEADDASESDALRNLRRRAAAVTRLIRVVDSGADAVEAVHAYHEEYQRSDRATPPVEELQQQLVDVVDQIARLEREAEANRTQRHHDAFGRVCSFAEACEIVGRRGGILFEYVYVERASALVVLTVAGELTQPGLAFVNLDPAQLAELAPLNGPAALDASNAPVHEALIAPIVEASAADQPVWIAGAPFLAAFPFHACIAGDRPLGERNPMAYVSSASVLRYIAAAPRAPRERGAIVLGDPSGDLPFARLEARAVARRFGAPAYLGATATISQLRTGLGDRPAVVHIACHGVFDQDDPTNSALVLAPDDPAGPDPDDTGLLNAERLAKLSLGADLVAMSACSTGQTDERHPSEWFGIARAVLYAGAAAAVVTLWPVPDIAAYLFFEAFYVALDGDAHGNVGAGIRTASRELRTMTARDLADRAAAAPAVWPPPEEAVPLWLAAACAAGCAGDARAVEHAAEALQAGTSARRHEVRDYVERMLARARDDASRARGIDYARLPFAAPVFWAPFALFGDTVSIARGTRAEAQA